ncbi:hypothetical protein Micbo1qcDRAFT_199963 [Microdochium bolleyi]|uniref:BTB domain-containing protein n=1 Tax=Microdochium bolleyi TaxID=196109 RepID=A0A136JJB6_9PEZI|nr:hypothetical protein Micbo1qcDRAFT_199963 [Microdochium bolleyi]
MTAAKHSTANGVSSAGSNKFSSKAASTVDGEPSGASLALSDIMANETPNQASPNKTDGEASDASPVVMRADTIKITVSGTTIEGSGPALMLASPVWDEKLRALGLGVSATDQITLPLDGDVKSADILMSIVHYRFGNIPHMLTLSELYQLCLMLAQYRCAHLVLPWARGWIGHFRNDAPGREDAHKALWIAYTLGEEAWYKRLLKSMILTFRLDEGGNLANRTGVKLLDMILPTQLFDIISETRIILLETIFKGVADSLKNTTAATVCRVGKDTEHCKAIMLGSAMPQLTRDGLFFPSPKAEEYKASVQDLVDTIKAVKSLTFVSQNSAPHQSHAGCSLGLASLVDGVLEGMPLMVTDEHKGHLLAQRLLSGITSVAETYKAGEPESELEDQKLVQDAIVMKPTDLSPSTPKTTQELPLKYGEKDTVANGVTDDFGWSQGGEEAKVANLW